MRKFGYKTKAELSFSLAELSEQVVDIIDKCPKKMGERAYVALSMTTELVVILNEALSLDSEKEAIRYYEEAFEINRKCNEFILMMVFERHLMFEDVYFLLNQLNQMQAFLHHKLVALTLMHGKYQLEAVA